MAHDRVDHQVGLAPGRVDRAVAAGDRAQPRLERAQRHLVAPVQALLVRPVAHRRAAPRRTRSRRAGRRTAPPAAGARPAPTSRSRPRTRRSRRLARSTAASWARTLPPRGSSSTRSAPAARARAAVSSGEPSQATITSSSSCRVVERAEVRDALGDHLLLGVRGDDHRHGGQLSSGAGRARRRARRSAVADRRQQPEQHRIAGVGVDDQADRQPRTRSRR